MISYSPPKREERVMKIKNTDTSQWLESLSMDGKCRFTGRPEEALSIPLGGYQQVADLCELMRDEGYEPSTFFYHRHEEE